MISTIVVAASENNVIGINNQLPWHLSDDLKFFKKTTLGKPVLMGRKTFESLGRPLPKRLNIVLSRSNHLNLPEGVLQFKSYDAAIDYLQKENVPELCIIGGGVVFKETMNKVDQIFITRVHKVLEEGDVYFPEIDSANWEKVWEEYHAIDENHSIDFTFQQYKRIQ